MDETLQEGLTGGIAAIKGVLANPVATAIGGAVVGSAITGAIIAGTSKAKSSRSKSSKKGRSRDRKFISKQKHEVAYQRRRRRQHKKTYGKKYKTHHKKSKSKRGIHYTKNGQPYKILSSGKARFIKR